jgi:cell division protein FtsQ
MSEASTRFAQWTENKFYSRTANAGFAVQDILVEGRHYTDIDAIRAIISSNKGDPLFAFKPDDAQSQLQKLSWVKSVQVERRFPDTIYVNIHERKPMALWQRNKRLSLIDEEGVVLTEHKLERFQDYVIVIGASVPEQAPAFLRLLRAEPEIQKRVEAATLVSNRRWDLTLKNGAIIKLPEEEPALALRRLAAMHEEEQLMDKDIKAIDVRELNRITVRTLPGAVQEYKTGYQKASGGAI